MASGEEQRRWDLMRRIALARKDELQNEVAVGDIAAADWVDAAVRLSGRSFGDGRQVCALESVEGCGAPNTCPQRCGDAYWLAHSRHVAQLMAAIAGVVGAPVEVWRTVGLAHDADYVRFPHHVPEVDAHQAHPFTVLDELAAVGTPPSVRLAILQHAAHVGLCPSSALAAALIVADEHSTMTALGMTPHYGEYQHHPVCRVLQPAPHHVDGYRRSNMQQRSADALSVLLAR